MRSIPYRLLCFIIAIITFLLYVPSLKNGFVNWDDNVLVYENPGIRSIDPNLIKAIFSPSINPTMQPFNLFSYAIDYSVWGIEPFGFHLTNIILHSINTSLVFILVVRLIEWRLLTNPPSPPFAKGGNLTTPPLENGDIEGFTQNFSLIAASITALLFGIHPLNAEAVNWVTGRSDLLSAFFFFVSLLSYLRFSIQSSYRNIFYCLSLLSFLISLMSKPTSVSLPLTLVVLDLYLLKSTQIKEVLINKIPFILLSLLSVVSTLWYRQSHEVYTELGGFPLVMRLFIAVQSFMFYLYKMALPFNLAPYYPYPKEIGLLSQGYLVSFILLASLTVFCIMGLKKRTLYSGVWLCYIISLSPMVAPLLGFYKIGGYAEADRYAYIALIGPFFLLGFGAAKGIEGCLDRRLKAASLSIFCIISIFLVVGTVRQTAIWHDSVSLWSHEIKHFPDTDVAYGNRGDAYSRLENEQQAIIDYSKAIEINPKNAITYINRGASYNGLGKYQQAIIDYSKAIEINPKNAIAYVNRGTSYNGLGKYQQAIIDCSKAIEINPKNAIAYINRGIAYFSLGSHQQAIIDFNRAVEINPQDAGAYYNLGHAYNQLRNYQQSIENYRKAAELGLENAQDFLPK